MTDRTGQHERLVNAGKAKDQVPDEKTDAFRQLGLEVPQSEVERDGLQGSVAGGVSSPLQLRALCTKALQSLVARVVDGRTVFTTCEVGLTCPKNASPRPLWFVARRSGQFATSKI